MSRTNANLLDSPKDMEGIEKVKLKYVALGFFNGTCVTFDQLTTKMGLNAYLDEACVTIGFTDVDEVFKDITEMEQTICDIVGDGVIQEDTYEKVAKMYGMSEENWITFWFCYIHTLLKVGRIEDNDDFGFMFLTEKAFDESKTIVKQRQENMERCEREKRELAEKAEQLRIQLEKEVEEQEHKIELAKAEEKRKAEEVKAKAKAKSKEASKRNIPPFPPNMKERGKQDSTMVCNKKAQLEWLKKHVPNWDGVLWNKKQANKYIDDIKKGIDVIVCDRIPVAEACGVCNDDFEGLVHAEASTADAYNL